MKLIKRDLQYIIGALEYQKDMIYSEEEIKNMRGEKAKKYIKKRDKIKKEIDRLYQKLQIYYNKVYE
jgi:hypothetical protein